jgi:cysteinyl-tRNA synthetase
MVEEKHDIAELGKKVDEIVSKYIDNLVISKDIKDDFDNIIVPILETQIQEATEYYEKRQKFNKKLIEKAKQEIEKLENALQEFNKNANSKIDYELRMMSSVSSGLNLIGDSDVDYGLLVHDLTPIKTCYLIEILKNLAYEFNTITEDTNRKQAYQIRYQKYIQIGELNIEFEVKIRDYDGSKPMIELHNRLDNEMPEKHKILITYGKKLLSDAGDKKIYTRFKTLFHNYYFYGVENSYFMK